MRKLKYLLAFVCALILSACGGGSEEDVAAISPQSMASVSRSLAPQTVTPVQAADIFMNLVEQLLPGFFPAGASSITVGPFRFRYYASVNTYVIIIVGSGTPLSMNGIYVVGGAAGGTFANPHGYGTVNQLLPYLTIDPNAGNGGGNNHTLTVTVSVVGTTVGPFTLQNVPAPNSQQSFCDGLANDTTFTQIAAQGQGTLTINSCSYNGSVGNISATLDITVQTPLGPFTTHVPYTITYTYT
ncbi:MAG TPA: hypothetical protein VHA82_13885 [Ramlibacter sp.]|uniref:hypothetical protein n=1 Tax=Ramlibacter sp. TaxID=1917967 RepID=UPI002CFF0861|nr:hypothetical protein [Ramlibacter sp.]HVZ44896.1 hypothetical protein [Ramlibacter sp.]